jgi:MarR family transcriptional regulator, organic hydroperoxide resistance regulator
VINESIVLAVQRTAHATAHALSQAVSADRLSPAEANAIANLEEPLTVSRLAAAAGVKPTTLTSLLDRLEGRALLTRRPAPGDRRALVVELTPAGREVAGRVRMAIDELERRSVGSLTAPQRAALVTALEELTKEAR